MIKRRLFGGVKCRSNDLYDGMHEHRSGELDGNLSYITNTLSHNQNTGRDLLLRFTGSIGSGP